MPAPHSKFDLPLGRPGLAGGGWADAASRTESAATVLLVVAVLSAGLVSGLLVIWRSLV